MKLYTVAIPITGVILAEVKAEDEDAAIEAAFNRTDLTLDNIEEWDMHRQIVEGNVFHGLRNSVDVIAADDIDD